MPNIDELIRDHVTLSVRCLDRVHLHACMPKLQRPLNYAEIQKLHQEATLAA